LDYSLLPSERRIQGGGRESWKVLLFSEGPEGKNPLARELEGKALGGDNEERGEDLERGGKALEITINYRPKGGDR